MCDLSQKAAGKEREGTSDAILTKMRIEEVGMGINKKIVVLSPKNTWNLVTAYREEKN